MKIYFEKIFFDAYTGSKMDGRKEWAKLMKVIKPGDTIIFDSVSRMSRSEDEGVAEYFMLYDKGVHLRFIKEEHINTDVYRYALTHNQIPLTGTDVDPILEGINTYLKKLAEIQIRLAFRQAEKELLDLRQRTCEGIITAKLKGKQPGRKPGPHHTTKKELKCKPIIMEMSKSFGGKMSDQELIDLLGIARHTYYTYKKELKMAIYGAGVEHEGPEMAAEN